MASASTASPRNSSVSLLGSSGLTERCVSATRRCCARWKRYPSPASRASCASAHAECVRLDPRPAADAKADGDGLSHPRVGPLQACAQVVARVAPQRPALRIARGLHQHLGVGAVEALRELGPLPLAGVAQAAGARRDRPRRQVAVELGGGGAAAHRVGKHVAVGDRARLDEAQRALEGVVVLAREAGDEIRADGGGGEQLADHRQPLGGERRVVPPAHARQHAVVARLQRHVEMRADRRRRGHPPHQRLAHLVRIDRGQADAREPALLDQRVDQPDEIERRVEIVSPAAEMDAGEDHLAEAARGEGVELGENRARRQAPAAPAGERHDAERAEQVAAFLDLQEGARLAVERAGTEGLDPGLAPAAVHLHPLQARRLGGRGLHQRVEPVEADDVIDGLDGRRRQRLRLGVAARQDDPRGGIAAPRAAREPPALGVGGVGHRAGVDDDHVGRRVGVDQHAAGGAQAIRDGRRVVGVHLAAERRDRDAPGAHAVACAIQPPPATRSPR